MKIHLFQSVEEPGVFGFTPDEAGANLPAELAPWMRAGQGGPLESEPMDRFARHARPELIAAAIQRDGFYVAPSEPVARNTDHDGIL